MVKILKADTPSSSLSHHYRYWGDAKMSDDPVTGADVGERLTSYKSHLKNLE